MKKTPIITLALISLVTVSAEVSLAAKTRDIICEAQEIKDGMVILKCGANANKIEAGTKYKLKEHIEGC